VRNGSCRQEPVARGVGDHRDRVRRVPRRGGWTLGTVDREGVVALLAEILTDRPQLTGAACIGKHAIFDPIVGNGLQYRDQERVRLAKAARVCGGCPVIHRCPCATTTAAGAV
jgi:hypothetical protein